MLFDIVSQNLDKIKVMSMKKRQCWYIWENLAAQRYIDKGYVIRKKNFTIRGWEIDLIVENDTMIICVEVKVVHTSYDISWYITSKKMKALQRTFHAYLHTFPSVKYKRMDLVIVRDNVVCDIFENISM